MELGKRVLKSPRLSLGLFSTVVEGIKVKPVIIGELVAGSVSCANASLPKQKAGRRKAKSSRFMLDRFNFKI
jgi:hypothetical protein